MSLTVKFLKLYYTPDELAHKLVMAVESNNEDKVDKYVKAGAPLDTVTYQNTTPLTQAIWRGREDNVSLFLKSGADPNFCDFIGRSPLFCFVSCYGLCDDRSTLITS